MKRSQKLIFLEGRNLKNYVSIEEEFSHIRLYIASLHPIHNMDICNLQKMYVIGPHIYGIYILVADLHLEIYLLHKGNISF